MNWKNETYPAMTSEHIDYIDLIPDYISGILEAETRSKFEKALETDPELKRELDEFRELQSLYREALPETPEPSDKVFARVMDVIEKEEQSRYREITYRPSFTARAGELLSRFRQSLSLPWGLALVQAAVIVLLLIPHVPENSFTTLGLVKKTPAENQTIEKKTVSLNIVFNGTSPESKIRELLVSVDATIISGPSPQGRYQIAIPAENESLLGALKQSELVIFVEESY